MRLKEIEPNTVIHCPNLNDVVEILRKYPNPTYYTVSLYDRYEKNTCIRVNSVEVLGYDSVENYMRHGYKITEFSDLIIPELSAKEVLETMKEICKYHSMECSKCFLNGNCDPTEDSSDKIIEICTKWREEHPKEEKKELETEWVYVVRIIKVHDNSKKQCVHEVVCNIEFSDMDKVAEAELKHYCSEHKGNFFATLEHICRIKE